MRFKYFDDSLNIILALSPDRGFFCAKCVQYFKMYRMKSNKEHFSSEIVTIHYFR